MARHEQLSINNLVTPNDNRISFAAAAPTTGTAKKGDIVFNTAPAAGDAALWVCTTAGSPGTWKAVNCAA